MTEGARRVIIEAINQVYCDWPIADLEKLDDQKLMELFIKAFNIEI